MIQVFDIFKTRILRGLNFARDMRLHIGLLFSFPYFCWGFFTAWSFTGWDYLLVIAQLDRIFAAGTITLLLLPFIFVANDVFDAPYDAQHEKKRTRNYFCTHSLTDNIGVTGITLILPVVVALVCSWLLGLDIFVLTLLVLGSGFFYTFPPFRFKEVPVADFSSHGLYVSSYFYFLGVYVLLQSYDWLFHPLFLTILLLSWLDGAWLQLISQISDYEVDKLTSQRSTAVWLGKAKSIALLFIIHILMLLCLPAFIYYNDTTWKYLPTLYVELLVCVSIIVPVGIYVWKMIDTVYKPATLKQTAFRLRLWFIYPFSLLTIPLMAVI